ncbi:hypothetical protein, partial [Acidaminococcus timonensis]|uniref:hypothetical protein n=1 Tax=Acidaminococcus timonensis TaxID=1871002 RepID=UPI00307C89CC
MEKEVWENDVTPFQWLVGSGWKKIFCTQEVSHRGEIVCPMLDLSTIAQMRNGPPSLPGKDKGFPPFKEIGLTAAPTFVNKDIRPFQGRGTDCTHPSST